MERLLRATFSSSARLLAGLAFLGLGVAGCGPASEPEPESGANAERESSNDAARTPAPVLLLAIDGMEWSVMQPLLAKGELPHLAGLMERGQYGYLRSMQPTFSPVIWTSIATGKPPQRHGILHFVYPTGTGAQREMSYYTSGHRRTKAFWNILSDAGRPVHTFGWWMTFPVEAVNGVMVSQTNTTSVLHDPRRALWKGTLLKGVEGQVHPPDFQNAVMTRLEEIDAGIEDLTRRIFGAFPEPFSKLTEYLWSGTLWAFRADAVYLRTALDVLERDEEFALMAVYVGGADVSAHRFWRFAYPEQFGHRPRPAQLRNFGDVIDDYYRYVDASIGELLDAAGDSVNVVIVSDHGMRAINQEHTFRATDPPEMTNSGNHLDAPPGVFLAAGPQIRPGAADAATVRALELTELREVCGVLDVLPTLLAILGEPVGEDFGGRVVRDVIAPDWLAAHPPRAIPTHDDPAWLASRSDRMTEAVDQNDRIAQLKELGYVD